MSVPIPAREVAGMAHEERSILLLESTETDEKTARKPIHWTAIANLITLIGGMVGSLFNSPWVMLGLAAPLFAAISFAFAGPKRQHSGVGAAILTFLLFFITLITLEFRESLRPGVYSFEGYYTFVAVLMLLVCWLAYAIANRFFAPDPKAAPDASHGLNMEADPESKLK